MPKSYSSDLRKKVVEYISSGKSYDEASKLFTISVSAIGRWYRRYQKEGVYEAKKRGGSSRKINISSLRSYVESHPNMILKDASVELKVSIYTVSYWLKKLGYSYKKKPLATWKQAQKSVQGTKKS